MSRDKPEVKVRVTSAIDIPEGVQPLEYALAVDRRIRDVLAEFAGNYSHVTVAIK